MKLLFLSHHWSNNSHHSLHSGFQRLVHFAAAANDVTLVTWAPQEQDYMDGPIRVIAVKTGRHDFLFQKRIAISRKGATLAPTFDAVHSLYEDCTFALQPRHFITTIHVLPGVVHYHEPKQRLFLFLKYHLLQRRALRNAASIACVSTNLLAAIPPRFQPKARFIPHGVDTDFWDPALASIPHDLPTGYILCVGAHGLNRSLMSDLIRANPNLAFVFVGLKKQLEPFPNTRYLYNIPDEKLRDLYLGASLMVRPLHFATANNSVLEALSMGKTILASRIPGITDYLSDGTCIFFDTVTDHALDGIQPLDSGRIRKSAIDSFSWKQVLAEYSIVYRQQITHNLPSTSNQVNA